MVALCREHDLRYPLSLPLMKGGTCNFASKVQFTVAESLQIGIKPGTSEEVPSCPLSVGFVSEIVNFAI